MRLYTQEYTPEIVKAKNAAAASLASWIHGHYQYFQLVKKINQIREGVLPDDFSPERQPVEQSSPLIDPEFVKAQRSMSPEKPSRVKKLQENEMFATPARATTMKPRAQSAIKAGKSPAIQSKINTNIMKPGDKPSKKKAAPSLTTQIKKKDRLSPQELIEYLNLFMSTFQKIKDIKVTVG